ncbi:hypothetical protein ACFVMC_25305 [Nocardia sp. NPDC127579]|uniref:hypothetical protein n=1 Tax=Nocardia sp. NPDC127579 TaxID=3345402 RepID=UPI00362974EC
MNAFLGELGKKLAERWVTLLVLPGLLWVATAVVAHRLGRGAALDLNRLHSWFDGFVKSQQTARPGVLLAVTAGILVAAAGAGLAAGWLGRGVERVWMLPGRRRPLRWLTRWRRWRWDRAYRQVTAAIGPVPGRLDLAAAMARTQRIAPVPAERPLWIGDRLRALDVRVWERYRLDVSVAWPRLWFVMPEGPRADMGTAHESYATAARLFGWAILYLLLGAWWWPALGIAAAVAITAWSQARAATSTLADLAESAIDLYGGALARELGFECPAVLTPEIGTKVTKLLRKDETFPPPGG